MIRYSSSLFIHNVIYAIKCQSDCFFFVKSLVSVTEDVAILTFTRRAPVNTVQCRLNLPLVSVILQSLQTNAVADKSLSEKMIGCCAVSNTQAVVDVESRQRITRNSHYGESPDLGVSA